MRVRVYGWMCVDNSLWKKGEGETISAIFETVLEEKIELLTLHPYNHFDL